MDTNSTRIKGYRGKRLFDVLVALGLGVMTAPVMAVVAVLVGVRLGRPVLFRQQRPGLNGEPFTLYKFRTMADLRDTSGEPLPDAQRLTGLGRTLRALSLDELPELWNVLRGDMSLVGPRPLLMRYVPYFRAAEARRFDIRPGITGWAQVNGRNDVAWDERLALDVWYVQHCSLSLDLAILGKTVSQSLARRNVRVVPGTTMLDLDVERSGDVVGC